ncbi:AAA family ATPase [Mycobacterium sp. E2327]|uniref:AAA family ATPase n=1 Tax=Mycobacterium sp. E2327 TaxID=1834132 RepID=UPI000A8058FB|nr:AAA family ATPase [Mycobacterium sp. E2327]
MADIMAALEGKKTKADAFDDWFDGGEAKPHRISGGARAFIPTDADQRYALGALERLAGEVAMAPIGERNDKWLNPNALRAYRVADGNGLDRQIVTDTMMEAGRRCGLPDAEIDRTLRSARNGADKYGPARRDPGEGQQQLGNTTFDPAGQPSADEAAEQRQLRIEYRAEQLRIDSEAKALVAAETRPKVEYPPVRSLTELLAQPCPPTRWRIEQVAPIAARIILSAQYKAGKTTLRDNMVRCLADREPFLGQFAINDPASALVLIDDELSEHMVQDWLGRQGIRNTNAVADVITLRGKVSAFNLFDDDCRETWAKRFRDLGCDYLILDCLRPILDAFGLDENRDAGLFLVQFDAMLESAGIRDALLVHHMGHSGERSRGDSRLLDWPDANWRLLREDPEDPASDRYFSAFGRDVAVPEGRLSFDPATQHLRYAPGSRGDAQTEAALAAVIEVLVNDARSGGPGMSGRAIEGALMGVDHTQKAVRSAVKLAEDRGLISTAQGARNATLRRIAQPCCVCFQPLAAGQVLRHEACVEEAA